MEWLQLGAFVLTAASEPSSEIIRQGPERQTHCAHLAVVVAVRGACRRCGPGLLAGAAWGSPLGPGLASSTPKRREKGLRGWRVSGRWLLRLRDLEDVKEGAAYTWGTGFRSGPPTLQLWGLGSLFLSESQACHLLEGDHTNT